MSLFAQLLFWKCLLFADMVHGQTWHFFTLNTTELGNLDKTRVQCFDGFKGLQLGHVSFSGIEIKGGFCFLYYKPLWEERILSQSIHIYISMEAVFSTCSATRFRYQRLRSRYRFERQAVSWSMAAEKCKQQDSKLIQISSVEEHRLAIKIAIENGVTPDGGFYVGAYRESNSSVNWIWHRSKQALLYRGNGTLSSIGLKIASKVANLKFYDTSGAERLPYICECRII